MSDLHQAPLFAGSRVQLVVHDHVPNSPIVLRFYGAVSPSETTLQSPSLGAKLRLCLPATIVSVIDPVFSAGLDADTS